MSASWVRIRSWHRIGRVDVGMPPYTICGLRAKDDSPMSETLPLDERSCESCLRLAAAERAADLPASVDTGSVEP